VYVTRFLISWLFSHTLGWRCCVAAVIQTGLHEIGGLMPVGHSLMRLVITEQKISRMENLYLPNLRDLLLHCNEIVRIEGLDRCPKLQRLWLFSNRIAKIENLEGVPDLRELWLQVCVFCATRHFRRGFSLPNLTGQSIDPHLRSGTLGKLASHRVRQQPHRGVQGHSGVPCRCRLVVSCS
jgi:hypothetical protein